MLQPIYYVFSLGTPPSQNMKYAFSLTSSKDILNEFKNVK